MILIVCRRLLGVAGIFIWLVVLCGCTLREQVGSNQTPKHAIKREQEHQPKQSICPNCKGKGVVQLCTYGSWYKCDVCKGTGRLVGD